MKQNVGSTDKIIRIILGILIAALGYYYRSWWGLIALVPLLTAFISFCPIYPILGLSTKKEK
jgi:predicted RND superfamily exporter protein